MSILDIQNLSVAYQGVRVLDDITFAIQPGEYVAVVGPNGSGKSTLLKAILGLIPSIEGSIQLCGTNREKFSDWSRIGYLPQVTKQLHRGFPGTVREIVASGLLSCKHFPRRLHATDGEKIDSVLSVLDIEPLQRRMIGTLSGGQQQRVLLARALVSGPDLLFLDEPTVALDPATRERFYSTLQTLHIDQGKTIVLVTHDSASMGEFAEKFLYLDRRLIFFGRFDEFCTSEEMTGYFGEHSQHLICHQHT
jgi:zinc transport system ATP-binding protein